MAGWVLWNGYTGRNPAADNKLRYCGERSQNLTGAKSTGGYRKGFVAQRSKASLVWRDFRAQRCLGRSQLVPLSPISIRGKTAAINVNEKPSIIRGDGDSAVSRHEMSEANTSLRQAGNLEVWGRSRRKERGQYFRDNFWGQVYDEYVVVPWHKHLSIRWQVSGRDMMWYDPPRPRRSPQFPCDLKLFFAVTLSLVVALAWDVFGTSDRRIFATDCHHRCLQFGKSDIAGSFHNGVTKSQLSFPLRTARCRPGRFG